MTSEIQEKLKGEMARADRLYQETKSAAAYDAGSKAESATRRSRATTQKGENHA